MRRHQGTPSTADGLRACLADAHRRYSSMINLREGWRGYLWQGRFASFPMDERHMMACARYIELNAVRAGLTERPEDWRWSSGRAHLTGRPDGVTDLAALGDPVGDWRAFSPAASPKRNWPRSVPASASGVRRGMSRSSRRSKRAQAGS